MDEDKFQKTRDKFRARAMEEKAKGRRAIFMDDQLPHRPRSGHPQPILRTIVRPTVYQPLDTTPSTSAAAAVRRSTTNNPNTATASLTTDGQNTPDNTENQAKDSDITIVVNPFPQFDVPERSNIAIISPMRPTAGNTPSLDESIISLSSESSPLLLMPTNPDDIPTPRRMENEFNIEDISSEITEQHEVHEEQFEYIEPNDTASSPLWVVNLDPFDEVSGVPSYTVTHRYEPFQNRESNNEYSGSESQSAVTPPPLCDVSSPSQTTYVMSRETSRQQATPGGFLQPTSTTSIVITPPRELMISTTPRCLVQQQPPPPVVMSSCSNSPVPSLLQRTPSPATTSSDHREQQSKRFFLSWEVEERQKPVLGNMMLVEGIARYRYFVERAPQESLMPQPEIQTMKNTEGEGVTEKIDPSPKRKLAADTSSAMSRAVVNQDTGLPRTPNCHLPSGFWERLPQVEISPKSLGGSSAPSRAPTPGIPIEWGGQMVRTPRNTPARTTLTRATLSLESLSISEKDESSVVQNLTDEADPAYIPIQQTPEQQLLSTPVNINNSANMLDTVVNEPVVPDIERWVIEQLQVHQLIENPVYPVNVTSTEANIELISAPENVRVEGNIMEGCLPDPELPDYLDIPVVYSSFEDLTSSNLTLREAVDMAGEANTNNETNATAEYMGPTPINSRHPPSDEQAAISFEVAGDAIPQQDWEQLIPMIEEMRAQNSRRSSIVLTLSNERRYRVQLRRSRAKIKFIGTTSTWTNKAGPLRQRKEDV